MSATESGYFRQDILDVENKDTRSFALIALAVAFGLWHIITNVYLIEPGRWQNAIHFAGFAFFASILYPVSEKLAHTRAAWAFDLVYGFVVAGAALWVAAAENSVYERTLAVTGQSWQLTFMDWAAGAILILACIDLARRVAGWVIPILVILSLSYILFLGGIMPGVFRAASLPLDDVLFRTLYNDEGLFGILATISSTNITQPFCYRVSQSRRRPDQGRGRFRSGPVLRADGHNLWLCHCQHSLHRGHHDPVDEGQWFSPEIRSRC